MQRHRNRLFALAVLAQFAHAGTVTVNDNGDGAGTCPATCTLRQAIATAKTGDTIAFAPTLVSPITLTQGELLIDKPLTIQGPGAASLTIGAQDTSRVLHIAANATISALEIADGAMTGSNGSGDGAAGGAGRGGCVFVESGIAAVLERVAVRHCTANGGAGAIGAPGTPGSFDPMTPIPGGPGGAGGSGGAATGGAISSDGSLSLVDSSVVDAHAYGGPGGSGGIGIIMGMGGIGGAGGEADGGAVHAGGGASLLVSDSTIAESGGTGGTGGAGGVGSVIGFGGTGGFATGGLLYVDSGAVLADLEFSTLANGSVTGGSGGVLGPPGIPSGNAITAGTTLTAASSIVVGAQSGVTVCYGSVTAAVGSANLSEDNSCGGFTLQATFAQTLRPLDVTATPWPGYLPVWHGPAIDAAASCLDLMSLTVAADEHGTARPQGATCDLGAIEADYVFVDGFE